MANVREATCKILELIDDGVLDRDHVIMAMLSYMSEADVAHMAKREGMFDVEEEEEDEEEEEWTPDNADYCDKASRHHY